MSMKKRISQVEMCKCPVCGLSHVKKKVKEHKDADLIKIADVEGGAIYKRSNEKQ